MMVDARHPLTDGIERQLKGKLVFEDTSTGTVLTNAQFKALPGVSISENPFTNQTTISFDSDSSAHAGGITLTGILDSALALNMVETLA